MTDPHEHRRENDSALLALMHQIRDDLRGHMESEDVRFENILQRSFPGGDPIGHRLAHEAQMQAVLDRAQFWKTMRFEIAKYGLLGLIGWGAVAMWLAFLRGPK